MNIEEIQKMLAGATFNIKGDLVMEKHVDVEIDNVEPGGIAIQNNYYGKEEAAIGIEEYNKEHPLAAYVIRPDKAKAVIEWMRHVIKTFNTPKDQLAVLYAAISCKPRAILDSVNCDVFNTEFGLSVAEESFGNWIRGHHHCSYQPDDYKDYADTLQAILKGENEIQG